MALSEHERRVLADLEKQLSAEEPRLAATLGAPAARGPVPARSRLMGLAAGVVGLGLLLAGVFFKSILVGVLGFAALAAGIYLAVTPPRITAGARPAGPASKRPAQAGRQRSSGFMRSLEDRWDERRSR
ncbi:DUF3040 domain-containing protein [Falsarthrobacter nasiphocae]|uniref:DUF3040 domain-containing protein n=1 Tax=Falsarthrobacter nasiphocae TaxID=189863 RepID=A0AAE3YG59_9MICC|nr:DUF3040 domain-containing protein [Falsarthrobacter nasiphocae]MDR6891328.1 hypothetical protein [Falsarthrobacter nasiphocae]